MSLTRRNIIANFGGKLWAALMSLAAVPFLLRLLGIEGFGIVGFHLTIAATLAVLDLGMATTLNRTLAQLSVSDDNAREMRDLVRTLESITWLLAVLIGAAVVGLAAVIAEHWIVARDLSSESMARAIALMGLAIAGQWPLALYAGGLTGLQRQVSANVVAACMATLRNPGAVLVLYLVEPSLQVYFIWQIALNCAETLLVRALLWRALPPVTERATVRLGLLAERWRFAAGVTGISVLAVVLTQVDKLVLSKVLPLEAFGYYMLGWRVAAGLFYLVSPLTVAYFPRFTQLAAIKDYPALAHIYHRGCQFASVAVIPVTVVLALFAEEVLLLWTADPVIARNCAPLLGLLAIGTAINGLMNLPLALQLAVGWTRLVLLLNSAAVIVLAPLTYLIALRHGGVGAAWVWIGLNSVYVVFMLQAMHRRVLPGELRAWFSYDVGAPLVASLAAALPWRLMVSAPGSYLAMLVTVGSALLLGVSASALATPSTRALIVGGLMRRWSPRP